MRKLNKIFQIGLNKTGTKSLHYALGILGFNSVHWVGKEGNIKEIIKDNNNEKKDLLENISHYDCYTDWSTAKTLYLFKKLDKEYPNSLFILTTRDVDDWVESRKKHIKRNLKKNPNKQTEWYKLSEEEWRKDWKNAHKMIYDYFKNKDNFLVINICEGEGWDKLCNFLKCEIPNKPFPHKNNSK
ncbi:MAG: sulfotransferase family protein [bacterium]